MKKSNLVQIVILSLASMAIFARIGIMINGGIVFGIILLIWNSITVVLNGISLYKGR